MPKFAIYTAVVGNYDEILQPLVVDSRFDYFLFSDTFQEDRIGVWQVKSIEYFNSDRVKTARYVKTHPETFLPNYAATLWMDANLQIVDSYVYERFLELFNQGVEIASVKHPQRDCIYEELFTVCAFQWETLEIAWGWNRVLRQNNYPEHNGLFETGLTYRLNSPNVKKVDEEWWNCIYHYSSRDQLSYNFVLAKCDVKCDFFLPYGESIYSSKHVGHSTHVSSTGKTKVVEQPEYLKRLFDYYREATVVEPTSFYRKWLRNLGASLFFSKILMYLWRQRIRITYHIHKKQ